MIWKILTGFLLSVVIIAVFLMPPPQKELGDVSRIFFFHVPVAWVAVLAFFVSMVNSIFLLRKREMRYDIQAASAARLGFLFCILAMITGMIFAKNTWGSFWNWDPKETSIFILVLIYGAYFALRSAVEIQERKASLSAVYSILAFLTVPFLVFVIPRVYQSLHPVQSVVDTKLKFQLPLPYLFVFLGSILGFSLIFIWLHKLEIILCTFNREREKE
ncbi:MAG: cytochrome c biogenesis protein CcsA [Candidatus Zixiibacteriota bacterium]